MKMRLDDISGVHFQSWKLARPIPARRIESPAPTHAGRPLPVDADRRAMLFEVGNR